MSNTTGSWNTATGGSALLYNLTGSYNTASGYQALQSNTTGESMQPYTTALGAIGVADRLELFGEAFIVKEGDIPPPAAARRDGQ